MFLRIPECSVSLVREFRKLSTLHYKTLDYTTQYTALVSICTILWEKLYNLDAVCNCDRRDRREEVREISRGEISRRKYSGGNIQGNI